MGAERIKQGKVESFKITHFIMMTAAPAQFPWGRKMVTISSAGCLGASLDRGVYCRAWWGKKGGRQWMREVCTEEGTCLEL